MRVSNISWLAKQSEIRWDEENTISLSVRSGMWRLGETVSNSKIGQARPIARHWKRERRRRWREKKQAANHTILCDCYCRYRNDAMERDGECVTSKSDSLKKNINRSLSDLTRFKMLNGCQAHTHTHIYTRIDINLYMGNAHPFSLKPLVPSVSFAEWHELRPQVEFSWNYDFRWK